MSYLLVEGRDQEIEYNYEGAAEATVPLIWTRKSRIVAPFRLCGARHPRVGYRRHVLEFEYLPERCDEDEVEAWLT